MGRRRTKDKHLPERLYKRADGYYYRSQGGGERRIVKGDDLPLALVKWAELEGVRLNPDAVTFSAVADKWKEIWLPTVAPRTQHDYTRYVDRLKLVFGSSALDSITKPDVAKYRDMRCDKSGKKANTQANREIACLSIIWNWASERGYTALPNPCAKLRRNKETGRSVYMIDGVFSAIYNNGDQSVKDAMNIAIHTGGDISVILAVKRTAVINGELNMGRDKTKTPVRYSLKNDDGTPNDFGRIVQEMLDRPRNATGVTLVQDANGQRIPYNTFTDRFDRARTAAGFKPMEYQFRDIRPKVATDADDVDHAQSLLGHRHRSTTERHYLRRGKLVKPAK